MAEMAARAASAAAAAACQSMAGTSSAERSDNMHKFVIKPDSFLGTQADWERFKFGFVTWAISVDKRLPDSLEACSKLAEEMCEVDMEETTVQLGHKLYVILVGMCTAGDVPKMARQIRDANGFELWRRLCQTFEPQSINKPLVWLRILNNPQFPTKENQWQKGLED